MMLSTLNRYIAKRIIAGLLLAFLVVTSIIMLVDFVEGTRNYGADENISAFQVFQLTALKSPQLIEQTIPFVVLFGVMGTLYSLNRRSELIVLRASGLSAWRFLTPALFVTASLGVIWALAFNPLASRAANAHDQLIGKLSQSSDVVKLSERVFLRDGSDRGQVVIRAESLDATNLILYDAIFWTFEFDETGSAHFASRLETPKAEWIGGYWQLSNVTENLPSQAPKITRFLSLPTSLKPEDLINATRKRALPPFWELPSEIKRLKLAGFSTTALILQLHRLLALPFTLIAMTFIAAGVSMHLTREGGTLRLMIFGGAMGFGVYFANNIMGAFGEIGVLPTIIAAWVVPIFVLLCGVAYLAKIEDG